MMGVPTVGILTSAFTELGKTIRYNGGFLTQRVYFVPHPITGTTNESCREKLLGPNPDTGNILWDDIVTGLTVADPDDQKSGTMEVPREEMIAADTPANHQQYFKDAKLTDFLPVLLPTVSAVNEMLTGTSHDRDEQVGEMQASGPHPKWSYTVENIASSCVMAGCKPEYLPVVLAIASTGVTAIFTSTTSFSRGIVVNGPIRNEIKMNSGIGAFGPFNEANACIGRAWTILSKCCSTSGRDDAVYMGTQGNPLNFTHCCVPENEERLPDGWTPLSVQRGFMPTDSVVTVFSGCPHGYEQIRALSYHSANSCLSG